MLIWNTLYFAKEKSFVQIRAMEKWTAFQNLDFFCLIFGLQFVLGENEVNLLTKKCIISSFLHTWYYAFLILKTFCPASMRNLFYIEFLVFQDNFTYARKFLEFFDFFWMSDESDNITFLAHTASTASTVSVGFAISRNIKVYDAF